MGNNRFLQFELLAVKSCGLLGCLVFALLLVTACAGSPAAPAVKENVPAWFSSPETAFPESRYLSRTGSGDSSGLAHDDAMAQLSQYFGVKVEALSTGMEKYRESRGKNSSESALEASVESSVKLSSTTELVAVNQTVAWQSKDGKWYQVCHIDRRLATQALRSRIDEINSRRSLLAQALPGAQSDYARTYALLKAGAVLESRLKEYQGQFALLSLPGLNPAESTDAGNELAPDFFTGALIRFGNPKLNLELTDLSQGKLGKWLSGKLSRTGFSIAPDAAITLKGEYQVSTRPGAYDTVEGSWNVDLRLVQNDQVLSSLSLSSKVVSDSEENARTACLQDAARGIDPRLEPTLLKYFVSSIQDLMK